MPAEPVVYSLGSTVGRFSGYFYQCYMLPLALSLLVLTLSAERKTPAASTRAQSRFKDFFICCIASVYAHPPPFCMVLKKYLSYPRFRGISFRECAHPHPILLCL